MSGRESTPTWQSFFAVLSVTLMVVSAIGISGAVTPGEAASPTTSTHPLLENQTTETTPTGASNGSDVDANNTSGQADSTKPASGSANSSGPARVSEFRKGSARSESDLFVPNPREVHVGETVTVGFRHKGGLCAGCAGFNYEWDVFWMNQTEVEYSDNLLLYESTEDMPDEIQHAGRVNTFRPTRPGRYILVANRTKNPSFGKPKTEPKYAFVTVTEDEDYFRGESRHDLLKKYAPKVNFHPKEEFYPTRYEAYVDNSNLGKLKLNLDDCKIPVACSGVKEPIVKGTSLLDLYTKRNKNDLYLNPRSGRAFSGSHSSYQENVVDDHYPKTIYGSVTPEVDFGDHRYRAVSYWMFYINDPKPYTASPQTRIAAKHTGDQEGVVILVNDSGPQWVATQQHFGGEIRAWDNIEKDGLHPELYVGEGSHPTFFGPKTPNEPAAGGSKGWNENEEAEYIYQQQYLCKSGGDPELSLIIANINLCGANDAGKPAIPNFGKRYIDPVEVGKTWDPSDYEKTLLTGNESWSEYGGSIYRYTSATGPDIPLGGRFKGSFLNHAGRFNTGKLELFTDKDSGDVREAWPTASQVDGIITPNSAGSQQTATYDASGNPVSVGVKVYNTGFQPHEFVVGQRGKPDTQRRVFVRTPGIEQIGIEDEPTGDLANIRTPGPWYTIAGVPVEPDRSGQVELRLSVFGEDKQLDTETIDLETVAPADIDIAATDTAAGTVDDPQPVTTTVRLERDGSAYEGPMPDFTVSVGGDEIQLGSWPFRQPARRADADQSAVQIDTDQGAVQTGDGEYTIRYYPPEKDEAGSYNLTVGIEDGRSVTRTDAITYSNSSETGVQVAANIQIDRSGSMGSVIDEAKEGGATFVEQSDDDDYISVVSYANSPRTDQSLTELSDGRSDAIDAIEGIGAFGGTNIGGSLQRGLDTLDSAPDGTTEAAILMTDGKRNDGPSEQQILEDIVPEYNEQGVCLYTIGFGSGADEDLLQDIADASDCGEYRFAGQEGEVDSINQTLQSVYQDLGGEVSDAETIASDTGTVGAGNNTTGQFVVDDSVSQTTANLQIDGLLDPISPAPGSDEPRANIQLAPDAGEQSDEIRLVRPDGTVLNTSDANVSKSVVGDTVIYRIDDPQAGEWSYELRNTQRDDAQYSVDVTGEARTELDVYTSAETYSPGSTANLTATLFGSEGPVGNATVEGTVTRPDGNTTELSFDERQAGVYDGTMAPEQAGEYTVEVTATRPNASLERQATTTFTVDATPPLSVSQSETPEIVGGSRGTFELDFGGETDANYSLELSEFEAVNGTATIPSDDAWLWNDSVSPQAAVNVTAAVERSTPAGTYEATLSAYDIDSDTVVTEDITIDVLDPATFDVELTETNAPVEGGDALNATARVNNTGDVSGTQNVSFSLYGVGSDTTELSLGSGESTTVEFSVPTTVAENGTRYAVVGSRTDRNATRVDVLGPAYFVAGMSEQTVIPENSSNMTLRAAAINRGDETATQELTLRDENGTVATRTVTLDPEEVRRVNFTYSTDAAAVGENLTLTSANTTSNTTLITRAMSYADSDGVIDSRGLDIAVLDWKDGEIGRDVLDRVTEYWATGEEVY